MEDIPGLLDAIKALGVAGGPLFALLWWLERKERTACQKENKDLAAQLIAVSNTAANALAGVTRAVTEVSVGTKEALGSLSQIAEILKFGVRERPPAK